MKALTGLDRAHEVVALLQSIASPNDHQPLVVKSEEEASTTLPNGHHQLLLGAFAHIPFFANLPKNVQRVCSQEPFGVRQIGQPKDIKSSVIYMQGAKLDKHAGLYVVLDGEVLLHSLPHSEPKVNTAAATEQNLGQEVVRLQPGDAFGDEVLLEFGSERDSRGGGAASSRARTASAPKGVCCIHLTSSKVLSEIATFLKQQSSALFFLHPSLCLEALRKVAAKRSSTEVARVSQCLDAIGVFNSTVDNNAANQLASTARFSELIAGQHVFLEGERVDVCHVVVYGQVVLCQDGAVYDASYIHSPAPQLGHVVDQCIAGDVLIDPAPWFHGSWPCSAVASTRAGIISIPESTYCTLRDTGTACGASRQFVQLLSKSARTRLDNQRVAQYVSVFRSMHGVAMDKRVELAKLMTLATYQPDQPFTAKAHQELILVSGQARMFTEQRQSMAHVDAAETGASTASQMRVSAPSVQIQTKHDESAPNQTTVFAPIPNVTDTTLSDCVQFSVKKCLSLHMVVTLATGDDLPTLLQQLQQLSNLKETADAVAVWVAKISFFVSSYETVLLARSLKQFCESSSWPACSTSMLAESSRLEGINAVTLEEVMLPGDVIGWHIFPCRVRTEGSRFRAVVKTDVAVIAHSDIEGLGSSLLFRRGAAYIQPQWQVKLVAALRSQPHDRSPEHVATTVMGLQNIPPLSYLRKEGPGALTNVCAQIQLRQLKPGAIICQQDHNVNEIFIVLAGNVESLVSARVQVTPYRSKGSFWLAVRLKTAAKFIGLAKNAQIRGGVRQNLHFHSYDNRHTHEYDEARWSRQQECIAVYGPGDWAVCVFVNT